MYKKSGTHCKVKEKALIWFSLEKFSIERNCLGETNESLINWHVQCYSAIYYESIKSRGENVSVQFAVKWHSGNGNSIQRSPEKAVKSRSPHSLSMVLPGFCKGSSYPNLVSFLHFSVSHISFRNLREYTQSVSLKIWTPLSGQ